MIHVAGPRYGVDANASALLAQALRNVLTLAEATKVSRIAVPAISTGIYGYPIDQAGAILMGTATAMAATLKHLQEIRFVLFSREALDQFQIGKQGQLQSLLGL